MAVTEAEQQQERTRERRLGVKLRLQQALLDLAGDNSFRDVKIERIAEAAGISRSNFYFYYRDKHELLMDAAAEAASELYERADEWWQSEGDDPLAAIEAGLAGVAKAWRRHFQILEIATEVSTYDTDVREFWRALVTRFVESTAEHIRAEQRRGQIDEAIDADRTAEVICWGSERCLYILVAQMERDPEALVSTLAQTWYRTLYRG